MALNLLLVPQRQSAKGMALAWGEITAEVRAEAEALVEEAREQLRRWTAEGDGGARREAKRLVHDALLVFPDLPAAKALALEIR